MVAADEEARDAEERTRAATAAIITIVKNRCAALLIVDKGGMRDTANSNEWQIQSGTDQKYELVQIE